MVKSKSKSKLPKTDEELILIHHNVVKLPKPTRFFKEQEPVRIGNLKNVVILKSYFNSKVYKVSFFNRKTDQYGRSVKEFTPDTGFFDWISIFSAIDSGTHCYVEHNVQEVSCRSELRSLLGTYCAYGYNLDPDYQRGLVWNEEEKTSLIDSIFNGVEIGRFVLRNLPYKKNGDIAEIVDGKQRLTTLIDFYLGRWTYRGCYFQDLSRSDRYRFLSFCILKVEVEIESKVQLLEYFKRINKTSHPISTEHFARIDKMIEEEI